MEAPEGKTTTYKGYTLKWKWGRLDVYKEFDGFAVKGNFSTMNFAKQIVREIEERKLHPEELTDLYKKHMVVSEQLTDLLVRTKDAVLTNWTDTAYRTSAIVKRELDHAIARLEKEISRLEHQRYDNRMAALFIKDVQNALNKGEDVI